MFVLVWKLLIPKFNFCKKTLSKKMYLLEKNVRVKYFFIFEFVFVTKLVVP